MTVTVQPTGGGKRYFFRDATRTYPWGNFLVVDKKDGSRYYLSSTSVMWVKTDDG